MEMLKTYKWPGNVRELRNVLERGLIMARGEQLNSEHLPERITGIWGKDHSPIQNMGSLRTTMAEVEKKIIVDTLRSANGNRIKAAMILGLHRSSLYEKMKHYGVS